MRACAVEPVFADVDGDEGSKGEPTIESPCQCMGHDSGFRLYQPDRDLQRETKKLVNSMARCGQGHG